MTNIHKDYEKKCQDYGLKCLKCPYWNKYSRYCTKIVKKIWSETH